MIWKLIQKTSRWQFLIYNMPGELSVIANILFGAFGLGYFVYGKRQKRGIPFICGIGLMIFPYFVSNTALLISIGSLLMILPFLISL